MLIHHPFLPQSSHVRRTAFVHKSQIPENDFKMQNEHFLLLLISKKI